ncbi:hypothetical protein H4582DRAFT_1902099 [Lactarius indigo]|nr:hypothetical protein H4582DRAFT_1902099 [Lactarius indigo]
MSRWRSHIVLLVVLNMLGVAFIGEESFHDRFTLLVAVIVLRMLKLKLKGQGCLTDPSVTSRSEKTKQKTYMGLTWIT